MPRTKISEFSATPGNNTDIDGINLAEGCAPSGINDAIRELMAQLKDFQAGTAGDSFNGPIGTTTPAAGVFTNLSASGTFALTGDQVQISEGGTGQTTANAAFNALAPSQSTHAGKYLKTDGTNTSWDALDISTADITGTLPIANGGTGLTALGTGVQTALGIAVGSSGAFVTNGGALGTPSSGTVTNLTGTASININGTVGATTPTTGAFTTLSASGNITVSGGTANGVAYLNGSKVLTTGSALTFDGTNFATTGSINAGSGQFLAFSASAPSASNFSLFGNSSTTVLNGPSGGVIQFNLANSEQMRLTTTGLGIGTSSPGAKLEVAGAIKGTATAATNTNGLWLTGSTTGWNRVLIENTGGSLTLGTDGSTPVWGGAAYAGVIGTNGSLPLQFMTSGVLRATLDSSGNLGLGVTPSAWGSGFKAFEVGKAGSGFFSVGTDSLQVTNNYYYNGTNYIYAANGYAERYHMVTGQHIWFTAPSGTAGNAISFTQAMTLDASGRLGVGLTSLTETFEVNGSINASTASANAFGTGNQRAFMDYVPGSTMARFGHLSGSSGSTSGVMAMFTNGTERARITSGGDLLVGTTTTAADSAGFRVFSSGRINASDSTVPGIFARLASDGECVRFQRDGTDVGSVDVTTTSTSYTTSSDYRLKNNPQPLTGSGAFIDALKPKTWNWAADGSKGVGFIAHEVQEVSPGSVVGTKDAVDEEGKPKYQAMEYGSAEFIANIIAELQSLRARVAQLEAK